MDKLIEIRNQEKMCREHAQWDLERRDFWLAKAEEWKQCALDEIAFHFLECNGASITVTLLKQPPRKRTLLSYLSDRDCMHA